MNFVLCELCVVCMTGYSTTVSYGVATNSKLLKIKGLFCKKALRNRQYSAEKTYNFKEPTNRSHPISELACRTLNVCYDTQGSVLGEKSTTPSSPRCDLQMCTYVCDLTLLSIFGGHCLFVLSFWR